MEQTSHHPPRSHIWIDGPDNLWTYNGYLEFAIYAGLQTASVTCNGFKEICFADGMKIRWNQNGDYFNGVFMGTMGHQMTGTVTFTDQANNLEAYYQYGAYNFRKQDFVWGEMKQNGSKICEVEGNYMGYLDFDSVRYWDARETNQIYFPLAGEEIEYQLPS